jgi:hypothetical protein
LRGSRLGVQTNTASLHPVLPIPAWQSEAFLKQIWSEKYNYFVCLVPKCGSTSWLELIYKTHLYEEAFEDRVDSGLHGEHDYPEEGILFRPSCPVHSPIDKDFQFLPLEASRENRALAVLNDPAFFKFAVVRHPWSRLVSGFLNKYHYKCHDDRRCFQQNFVSTINTRLHTPLTLTELLETLLRMPHPVMNSHFRPSTELCDVGRIPYDFIADVDNSSHTEILLTKTKSPIPLYHDNVGSIRFEPVEEQVPCNRETVDLAARLYDKDLQLYGYSMSSAYDSCAKYGLAFPPK